MDPKTDNPSAATLDPGAFYDQLAPLYDEMTGFEKRFVQEKPFFRLLVDKFQIRTAIDAGSGTGFHSLLLAHLGVDVTAVDLSSGMLERLRQHANRLHLNILTRQIGFQKLAASLDSRVDAVFCLGNGLAHLISPGSLEESIRNFQSILSNDGVLFIQLLNYDRILSEHSRIQSTKDVNGKTFVRFYDYDGNRVIFNILTIDHTEGQPKEHLQSVELNPIRKDELVALLAAEGFTEIKLYGGIALQEFDPAASKDLVVLARRRNPEPDSSSSIQH